MPHEDPLTPTFIPALVTLLFKSEKRKGSPLTQIEVLAIRDKGVCIMLPRSKAAAMSKSRGYDDIDPERAWEHWKIAREQLQPIGGEA